MLNSGTKKLMKKKISLKKLLFNIYDTLILKPMMHVMIFSRNFINKNSIMTVIIKLTLILY